MESMTAQPQPHKSTLLRGCSRLYYLSIPPIWFSNPPSRKQKESHDEHKNFSNQFLLYFLDIRSSQLDKDIRRIFLLFPLGVLLLPWNNLYGGLKRRTRRREWDERSSEQKNKVRSFIYDNKQNSKRLEYKWMSVKCFDQPQKKSCRVSEARERERQKSSTEAKRK